MGVIRLSPKGRSLRVNEPHHYNDAHDDPCNSRLVLKEIRFIECLLRRPSFAYPALTANLHWVRDLSGTDNFFFPVLFGWLSSATKNSASIRVQCFPNQ
jgi:hypothetical protein